MADESKIQLYTDITEQIKNGLSYDYDDYMNQVKDMTPSYPGLKIAILGYEVKLIGPWDPPATSTGLPGSEECAVYGSQELARRGHQVDVYMDPPAKSIWRSPLSNPRWYSVDYFTSHTNYQIYDLVLMWRRFDPHVGKFRSKVVFFWPHDSPFPVNNNTPFPSFDGVCMLSQHHRQQFLNSGWSHFDKIPCIISGNGVLLDQFKTPMNFTNKYSIGYFSNYARGLMILLMIWPDVKRHYPEATLSICYGRQTWNTMPEHELQWVIHKIEEYKSLGVVEHGKVGHLELAKIMMETSVLAYPCTCDAETFCITLVKAQLAGMIPVITRIGALDETGHPEAPSVQRIYSIQDVPKYKQLLLDTLERIKNTDVTDERMKYIEYARQFSWENCVDKWLQLYHQIINK